MKLFTAPNRAPRTHKLFHYIKYLGIEYASDINEASLIMYYDITLDAIFTLPDVLKNRNDVINKGLKSVRKDEVEKVFNNVFGYSSLVNPLTHKACCIEKSLRNAVHDGKIVQCPIKPKEGKVYQKLVDTRIKHNTLKDIRVVVMKDEIPQVFVKEFTTNVMFTHSPSSTDARIENPSLQLSKDEIIKILQFSSDMNLEFGELDVLRSNETGRLYIVDVNPTPGYGLLKMVEGSTAIMAEHFKRIFL